MKLYTITLEHYSPKDSKKGIDSFLIAENDAQVYEWLKANRITGYEHEEEDGETYDICATEYPWNTIQEGLTFREKTIYYRGCANDPGKDLDDLYYGRTFWAWDEGQEITEADLSILGKYLGEKLQYATGR